MPCKKDTLMSLWLYPDDDHKGSIESRNFRKVVVLFERGLGEWFYLKEGSRVGGMEGWSYLFLEKLCIPQTLGLFL